jgi:hypothetical protein
MSRIRWRNVALFAAAIALSAMVWRAAFNLLVWLLS